MTDRELFEKLSPAFGDCGFTLLTVEMFRTQLGGLSMYCSTTCPCGRVENLCLLAEGESADMFRDVSTGVLFAEVRRALTKHLKEFEAGDTGEQ